MSSNGEVASTEGARGLLAAVVHQAIHDARAGRPCNGGCNPEAGAHVCAANALDFLGGPWCAAILAWLDLDALQVDLLAAATGEGEGAPAVQFPL